VDRVTKTMIERYDNVSDITEAVIRDSLRELTCQVDFSMLDEKEIGLLVINSTQFERTEVLTVTIDIPKEWNIRNSGEKYCRDFSLIISNYIDQVVPSQVVSLEDDTVFGYLKFGNVISFDATRFTVAFEAKDIPPNGYSTFTVKPTKEIQRPVQAISVETNALENEYMRVDIERNGTISLTDKISGVCYDKLNCFEDGGEKGGPLIYNELNEKGIYNTLSASPEISLVYNGPLFAQYRITYGWMLPEGLDAELKVHVPHGNEWIEAGKIKRSSKKKIVAINTDVILKKGSKLLEFSTEIDNTICDHRLRVMFPTGLSNAEYCYADSPFDIVRRQIAVPDSSGWYEQASKTWPSQSYISVYDGDRQFTLIHQGYPEYEVKDDKTRTIALTLLRSFRTAGNPTEAYRYQELAQCLGKHKFNYSIHIGKTDENYPVNLLIEAACFNVPLRAAQTTKHNGKLESRKSFFKISNSGFIVTAVKKSEYEEGFTIRGYNATNKTIEIKVEFAFPIKTANVVTLEEKKVAELEVVNNKSIVASIRKKEIISFHIKSSQLLIY